MTQNPVPARCTLLAQQIGAIFDKGLSLPEAARHYIESTFLCPSCEELKEILNDTPDCETESLLELIFFPDEANQLDLEDLLSEYPFEKKDEERVIAALFADPPKTVLTLSDDRRLAMAVPRAAAAQFVARLNIFKKIDAQIGAAISRNVPGEYPESFQGAPAKCPLYGDRKNRPIFGRFFREGECRREKNVGVF